MRKVTIYDGFTVVCISAALQFVGIRWDATSSSYIGICARDRAAATSCVNMSDYRLYQSIHNYGTD